MLLAVLTAARAAVTPFAGVWIEIQSVLPKGLMPSVTPFAGVWIEIILLELLYSVPDGHSLRGSVD